MKRPSNPRREIPAVWRRVVLLMVCAIAALTLTACKESLYTNLSEREVNEIIAILQSRGIDCVKTPGVETKWSVEVASADFSIAVDILKSYGYPHREYDSIGDVFKSGMLSSPVVERIRFIYAVSQELEATIASMDGVMVARVHVVLPQNNPLSDKIIPSSASVFVKHAPGARIQNAIPKIKELVVNSIEGLIYENVTVVVTESDNPLFTAPQALQFKRILGVKVSADTVFDFYIVVGGLGFLVVLVVVGTAVYYYLHMRKKKEADKAS
ncbi:MAG: type III secretion inner membrane ring lipoprotein SctJ [Nitrospirae bacterium]|nr:type III secretion inner membrane ring lipoprotein SctJ [Nitrospirota bacterium]